MVTFIVVPLTLASIAVPWDSFCDRRAPDFRVRSRSCSIWLSALARSGLAAARSTAARRRRCGHRRRAVAARTSRHCRDAALGSRRGSHRCSSSSRPRRRWARFTVTVLDVGQGLAVLVQTHAHALLYDTGPRFNESADAGNRIVAPMLRASGIARLDGMVVSHQDSDHSGGALSLLQTVPVGQVASSLPADHAIVARAGDAESAALGVASPDSDGDGMESISRCCIRSRRATRTPRLKTNDLSCVLRVTQCDGKRASDRRHRGAHRDGASRRDACATALRSDLLVVPHHGSTTSSTPAFIASVQPEVAAFTPGYRNRFGHPRPEIVERYDAAGVRQLSYRLRWRADI